MNIPLCKMIKTLNVSIDDVAKILNCTTKELMKKDQFDSREINKLVDVLKITNPYTIFFTHEVAKRSTNTQYK